MQLLPFSLSYLVLTPRQVRLPGEASPRSPHGRDRRGSKDSSGAFTTHTAGTSRSMSRSATSASSPRWSTRFRRALNLSTYKSPSSTSVPPVEASAPTLPLLTPPPPIASTSYSHSRSMSHPEVLESMVGGIPFPSMDSTDGPEFSHHRRHFSQNYDYSYSYHRVANGEFGQRNEMSLIDAAATAVAVASIGGVVEDMGRNRRLIDDDDEEEDYGREIMPMAYAI